MYLQLHAEDCEYDTSVPSCRNARPPLVAADDAREACWWIMPLTEVAAAQWK
jgi:hypothetical protein